MFTNQYKHIINTDVFFAGDLRLLAVPLFFEEDFFFFGTY
jgi:hypothetical protein